MSATCDPIADLGSFGYTEREAAFLYMTGIHSGYFLRRQFLTFLGREDGAIVQRFLRKSIEHGHVQPIEYATGRHLYHLKAKSIYRLLGGEDSQHRRAKGDRWIKARLMQVDYVLNHLGDPLLETTEQKISFFHEKLKIPVDVLPQANFASSGRPVYFPDGFPITIKQTADQHHPEVTLVFIDDGLRSVSAFRRWLEQHMRFLQALHVCEVVYAAETEWNFKAAEREFQRRFPFRTNSTGHERNVDHFVTYLKICTRYEKQGGGLALEEMRILSEGMKLYTSLEERVLLAAWASGSTNEEKIRAQFDQQTCRLSLRNYLLQHDYPVWSMKYRRSVL